MNIDDYKDKNNSAIDICKFICSLLVVAIHVSPFASISNIVNFYFVNVVARLAVPFFYVCSGYFFLGKLSVLDEKFENSSENRKK